MMYILSTRQSYLFLSFIFSLPTKILAYTEQWIGIPGEKNEYWLWENSIFFYGSSPRGDHEWSWKIRQTHEKFFFKKKYKKIKNITWKTMIFFFQNWWAKGTVNSD